MRGWAGLSISTLTRSEKIVGSLLFIRRKRYTLEGAMREGIEKKKGRKWQDGLIVQLTITFEER